jgi:hypothetical protein
MAQAGNDSIKSLKRVVNAISRNAGTLVAVPAAAVLAVRPKMGRREGCPICARPCPLEWLSGFK